MLLLIPSCTGSWKRKSKNCGKLELQEGWEWSGKVAEPGHRRRAEARYAPEGRIGS